MPGNPAAADVDTPSRVSRRHAATRAEILEAAWNLVRVRGLAALTLRDVASTVDMRAPSLYSYFPSKNAIYDAMFAQGSQEFVDCFRRLPVTDDALAGLRSGIHAFVRFAVMDAARYQLLFQRTVPGFEPSDESFAVSVDGLAVLRRRLAAHGFDEGVLDLLTALGTGLADQQISNDPGGDRWIRLIDDAMTMFHNHVSRQPADSGDPAPEAGHDRHRSPGNVHSPYTRTDAARLAVTEYAQMYDTSMRCAPTSGHCPPTARAGTCEHWPATSSAEPNSSARYRSSPTNSAPAGRPPGAAPSSTA